jgi:hypothetical protein
MMANGGQMFAEGGKTEDPAKGMTGASADAFRYLMGQSSASPATLAAQQFAERAPAPAPVAAAPVATDGGGFRSLLGRSNASQTPNYGFDPATGQLTVFQAPEVVPAASIPGYDYGSSYGYGDSGVGESASGGGSDGSAGAAVSGEAGWAQGGIASLAQGGQVNLQGTFTAGDQGGGGPFGQANANGYQAAGGGPIQGFSSSFGQMGGGMGGFDPRAVQANPQGFAQHMAQMRQREMAMPGSTMMAQGFAAGGVSHLGDYSDGGRLLKGPGDGVSDSIPATIANKRPARLADGEFVVPARIVSELGNGSTEAGARKLYAMMDRVQKARGKTTGKNRVAVNSRADKLLPA